MPKANKPLPSQIIYEQAGTQLTDEEKLKLSLDEIKKIKEDFLKNEGIFGQKKYALLEQISSKEYIFSKESNKKELYDYLSSEQIYESDRDVYLSAYIDNPSTFIAAIDTCKKGKDVDFYMGLGNVLRDFRDIESKNGDELSSLKNNITTIRNILNSYIKEDKEIPDDIMSILSQSESDETISVDTIMTNECMLTEDFDILTTTLNGGVKLKEVSYENGRIQFIDEIEYDKETDSIIEKDEDEIENENVDENENTDENEL